MGSQARLSLCSLWFSCDGTCPLLVPTVPSSAFYLYCLHPLTHVCDLPPCPRPLELVSPELPGPLPNSMRERFRLKNGRTQIWVRVSRPECSRCEFQAGFCPQSVCVKLRICIWGAFTNPRIYPQVAWRPPEHWKRENGLKGAESLEDPPVSWGSINVTMMTGSSPPTSSHLGLLQAQLLHPRDA